ncbi:hypothetical protein KJ365_12485 [Glaciecola sp. XM2]|uniref:hypothetical protein n=1 Tax=Glaciecola sp. XM2 TaxID=1914931 RepID=UPI001BDDFD12|nr:hypothetical protein [Glaciecola sp. XM2]MBT1451700.1 hypothetical protein [Glaciecola sp. XM2]
MVAFLDMISPKYKIQVGLFLPSILFIIASAACFIIFETDGAKLAIFVIGSIVCGLLTKKTYDGYLNTKGLGFGMGIGTPLNKPLKINTESITECIFYATFSSMIAIENMVGNTSGFLGLMCVVLITFVFVKTLALKFTPRFSKIIGYKNFVIIALMTIIIGVACTSLIAVIAGSWSFNFRI